MLAWAERADPRELLASERLPALLPDVLADKTNKKFPGRTPSSPLQAPLSRHVALLAERDAWLHLRRPYRWRGTGPGRAAAHGAGQAAARAVPHRAGR
ncbi:hypothetical protein G6F55_013605 [Rhizopus delemar]|nr:hypothetical protein G6F55_013605 [Rhizopus delemar]